MNESCDLKIPEGAKYKLDFGSQQILYAKNIGEMKRIAKRLGFRWENRFFVADGWWDIPHESNPFRKVEVTEL
jgi:hypothetical protein